MTLFDAAFLFYLRAWSTVWQFYRAAWSLYIQLRALRGES